MDIGRVLFPALRWDEHTGYAAGTISIDRALELGVGGFILFGGRADDAHELTTDLTRRAGRPLLFGSDLERGAGQQFAGATRLPPLAAIGFLDDEAVAQRAGEVTGREAVALGVPWVYAPMADVDLEPLNPIVGTRSFGADPDRVAALVAAWTRGCRSAGALSCAKHFPGHGRTTADSHLELPRVTATRAQLDVDLGPFRAAIAAGVDSIMSAHVAFPALDPDGAPATLSHAMVTRLLREELGFRGAAVTDALIMEGVQTEGGGDDTAGDADGSQAAVRALAAGCDALLYPADAGAISDAIRRALADGRLSEARVREAIARVDGLVARVAERAPQPPAGRGWGAEDDAGWALDVAVHTVHEVRQRALRLAEDLLVLCVDDDLGGPYPPPTREPFAERLRKHGYAVEAIGGAPVQLALPDGDTRMRIVAVYADIRAWKGRPGLSPEAIAAVARATREAPAVVCLFAHPRLARELETTAPVVCAWGGEEIMQRAAADWLVVR